MMHIKSSRICTACKSLCTDKDIFIREFDILPNLVGYDPSEVFDACRNAISFWLYQNEQEYAIHNAINEESEKEYLNMKHEIKSLKANYELEIESLKHNLERIERSLERERQNNYDLGVQLEEKIKQYQKLMHNAEKNKYINNRLGEITNIKQKNIESNKS
jgi:hypothetical protein